MDLCSLQALEREKVLEVLQRDKCLRSAEEERIRRLKVELQEIRRKGAKSLSRQYSERTCARCQRPLGKFWNSGAVCRGCSHRICSKCRVGVSTLDWKCTVCHAYRELKIKSGEWFFEERAKKFPPDTENYETTGEKLLKSYQRLSHIAVMPPTPPPSYDAPPFNRLAELKNMKKPFTKSMEDLMFSISSHMRRFSRSQEDVRVEQDLLTVVKNRKPSFAPKSLSDTDINKSSPNLCEGPSLPNLLKRSTNDDQSCSSSGADEELSLDSEYSEKKRGCSLRSTGRERDFVEVSNVTGELELAVAFKEDSSCLEVMVKRCRNLSCGDVKRKKCHPYVKVCLLLEKSRCSKLRTPVRRNTADPVYNEVLNYHLEPAMLSRTSLEASVWHSGTLKKKVFLGVVLVPLERLVFQDRTTHVSSWYSLGPKPECPEGGAVGPTAARELLVRMKFMCRSHPPVVCDTEDVNCGPHHTGQLAVLITGAKLLPTKTNISQNTFVKGCLLLPGSRELIQKTPVLKKPSPEWSHQLLFSSVTPSDLQIGTLEMELWDHAPFSFTDRLLGWVRIEADSSWRLLLQTPNVWHDFRLPMQASTNGRRT